MVVEDATQRAILGATIFWKLANASQLQSRRRKFAGWVVLDRLHCSARGKATAVRQNLLTFASMSPVKIACKREN